MKSRILATAAIAVALAVGIAAPAFAQTYTGALSANSSAPGGSVTYTSDDTGEPDGTPGSFTIDGSGPKADSAGVTLVSSVSRTIQVGSNSSLRFTVTIPKSAAPGSVYTLHVTAGKFHDTQKIQVVGVVASSNSGFNAAFLWIGAVVVLAALLIIFFIVRRRRQQAPPVA